MRRRLASVLLPGTALAVLVASPATAHVTASPNVAPAEGDTAFALRVPHGCGEAATTAVAAQMPAGVQSATPEQLPGWTVEIVIGELDEPYEAHGETVTEGVREVVWTAEPGNELPGDQFRDFGLSVRLAGEAGQTLYFPTVQTCTEGESAWIEIPESVEGWGELDKPAPYVTLEAAAGGHGAATPVDAELASANSAASATAAAGALTWAALALGLLGALAGVGALATARRR
ncbi:YcnI family copper-binding membrane protein [Egicoccus halophilus]|uniref:YncI copper-binding domain-containing protein n=1 Tax=Egicoccus halophilus TaxID=1670830 RepID=A0A8J3A758_9ACTN|nr:YcnI family protein [Egicoccus halophilus]GGI02938.1 hypothetical protein GCM10011354_02060 [Egicoccus halophilus]